MNLMTKKELWDWQAPSFNFELDEDQLLSKALELGFVSKTEEVKAFKRSGRFMAMEAGSSEPLFLINEDYLSFRFSADSLLTFTRHKNLWRSTTGDQS